MKPLPPFALTLLDSCPQAGGGVHNWLFRSARCLHPFWPAEKIAMELMRRTINCGRFVPEREVLDAVRNSNQCTWMSKPRKLNKLNKISLRRSKRPKWPSKDKERIDEIRRTGGGVADLHDLSYFQGYAVPHTDLVIDALFPGDPLICIGTSTTHFDTRKKGEWGGNLSRFQLVVPSPMARKKGKTQRGTLSARCLDNTGERYYQVIEFDEGDHDQQAALLFELAQYAPLCMAVLSGGKSLHGWFDVKKSDSHLQLAFMRKAVQLGADPATWTPCQFVRMPDGTRGNGVRQSIVYFNPENIQ
tara:strand:+ start:2244 stop:3149 length:906 start_codon:yes stop_codon:yes gene_type:complete